MNLLDNFNAIQTSSRTFTRDVLKICIVVLYFCRGAYLKASKEVLNDNDPKKRKAVPDVEERKIQPTKSSGKGIADFF